MTSEDLKKSILRLAFKGKLVEQRPEEGSAREFIKEINSEKSSLLEDKKIRKQDSLPEITIDEVPFEIPNSWEWQRLGNLISLISGSDLRRTEYNDKSRGIPYITGASNLEYGRLIINRWTDSPRALALKGDILLTCKGTIGKVAILEEERVHIARQIMAIRPILVDIDFVKYYLYSLEEYFNINSKSIIPGIERKDVLEVVFPLPPLSEQKRIVQTIKDYLPILEKYGERHIKFKRLNKEFSSRVRESVFQFAFQGKLNDRERGDHTINKLIEEINNEKIKLIKEGKIQRHKAYPEIHEDEVPFDIPVNWQWKRLTDVASVYIGNSISEKIKEDEYSNIEEGYSYIATKDVGFNGIIDYDNGVKIPFEKDEFRIAYKESTLLCIEGGSAGRKIGYLDRNVCFGNKLAAFFPILIDSQYLYYYLQSPVFLSMFKDNMTGIIGGVGIGKLRGILIPLPPLEEQISIVKSINKFEPYFEKLK